MENHECEECGWEFVINDYWDANYEHVARNDSLGNPVEVRCPNCDCVVYYKVDR